jgi:23S rRNA (cytosine1962-C5)-methyltransferase
MSAPAEAAGAAPAMRRPPCVVFEDEDLLVVNKPPGWNTHAPAPFAGEGLHDWLKHREPRWARLAIIHRLDKDTSGLMVFGKTPEANRSLTEQFARREVQKHYRLVTDRSVPREAFTVVSSLVRVGDRYEARPLAVGDPRAETHFRVERREPGRTWLDAEPVTGRTHQIRVHAAAEGFPILGDRWYGGAAASRLHLHAARLEFRHPRSGRPLRFEEEPDFSTASGDQLRAACLVAEETDAFRLCHGAADGEPGCYVDRLGEWLLVQGENPPGADELEKWMGPKAAGANPAAPFSAPRGVYFRRLLRQIRKTNALEASPQLLAGEAAPPRFVIRENGIRFELSFTEGYSVGLFLDQRANRRRLLTQHVAADFALFPNGLSPDQGLSPPSREGLFLPEVLNCFSYTCAFSVAAARGGARTTSLDLSRKYLDWGRRNFELNGLRPADHDFIYGDVFDWLQRLAKKARRFEVVLLDPPTFSRSREHGDFRAETDYAELVRLALPLLSPSGVLFASTNAARLAPEKFVAQVRDAISSAGRRVLQEHYAPQPPDFPVTRDEPAYLKTVWLRVA